MYPMIKRAIVTVSLTTLAAWLIGLATLICLSACSTDCSKVDCKAAETKPVPVAATAFDLEGSVTSAFSVTVDGAKYDDMEAYYTATVNSLDTKVQQLGYAGYSAKFTAQLGYSDLATGLSVYVTPATDRGYQGKTLVQSDGTFKLTLPPDASGDTYQVKATKRISLTLTKDKDVKRFCFNFSAVDLQVPYSDKDKPIVLNTFKTTITAYECALDPTLEGSLPIPAAPTPAPAATSTSTGTSTDRATADMAAATQAATAAEIAK